MPGSPAWQAGIVPGSRIVDWETRDAGASISASIGIYGMPSAWRAEVRICPGGARPRRARADFKVRPMVTVVDGDELPMLGIEPAFTNELASTAGLQVLSGRQRTAATQAGDRIAAINGQQVPMATKYRMLADSSRPVKLESSGSKKKMERLRLECEPCHA